MTVFSDEESALIDTIAIRMALDRLSPLHRTLLICYTGYEIPDGYAGRWPPRYVDTGRYLRRYLGKSLGDTRTRVRTARLLCRLATRHYIHRRPVTLSLQSYRTSHPLSRAA